MKQKTKTDTFLPWLFLALCFAYAIFFVIKNYYILMNSDTSSELLLGRILAENGGIITKDWFYSTELRVINTNIVYKFVYLIVGDNWFLYRVISNALLFIILISAYIFMTSALGLRECGIWSAGILILPFSPMHGYMVTYGAYYIPHLVYTFLSIGLIIRFAKEDNKAKLILWGILTIFIGIANGTGGVRGAMICYVPALIASFIILLKGIKKKNTVDIRQFIKCWHFRVFIASIAMFVTFAIGFGINVLFLSKHYAFKNQEEYLLGRFTIDNIGQAFEYFIKSTGIYENVAFMGPLGIVSFVAMSLVVMIIITLKAVMNEDSELGFYGVFSMAAWLTTMFVLGNQESGYTAYYWCPITPIFIPFLGAVFMDLKGDIVKVLTKYVLMFYLSACALLMGIATTKYPFEPRVDFLKDSTTVLPCRDYLLESGYTEGFACFWQANRMVELTNGKLDIWVTNDANMDHCDSTDYLYCWLEPTRHAESLPKGKFFVMTYGQSLDENYPVKCPFFKSDSNMLYADDYCTIYGFEDMNEYKTVLSKMNH